MVKHNLSFFSGCRAALGNFPFALIFSTDLALLFIYLFILTAAWLLLTKVLRQQV